MSAPANICLQCGAPRSTNARFCGACGYAFSRVRSPDKAARVRAATISNRSREELLPVTATPSKQTTRGRAPGGPASWVVVTGEEVPDSLIRDAVADAGREAQHAIEFGARARRAVPRGLPLRKQTIWMVLTQAADVVTQSMGGLSPPYTSERLMLASCTAVLSVAMRKHPRLRQWLVWLGALGMGLMQGGSLVSVLQQAVGDPDVLGSIGPNLAAQGASLVAILKLFKAAGWRH